MDLRIDYHIHSRYSDGTYEVVDIIKKYQREGYDEIAITDHDGIYGVEEAINLGKDYKLHVISGVEFSTVHKGMEMHLLGYKFDPKNEALMEKCNELRRLRRERNEKLIKALSDMGYPLDMDELEAQSKGGYVGKPHIARLLVDKGYAANYGDVFQKEEFFENPKIKAIKKQKQETTEAIKLIRDAGGIAVLAHPKKIKGLGEPMSEEYLRNLKALLKELKRAGLGGLEVWYATHTDEDILKLSKLAAEVRLLHMTTGSDFHGEDVKIMYTTLYK